jgi:hypothetical protein
MEPTSKDWIVAIGDRHFDFMQNSGFDEESNMMIHECFMTGLRHEPIFLEYFKAGSGLIEKDYFKDNDQTRNSSRRYKITRLR